MPIDPSLPEWWADDEWDTADNAEVDRDDGHVSPPADSEDETTSASPADSERRLRHRRFAILGAAAAVVFAGVAVATTRTDDPAPVPPPLDIALDGWAPYFAIDDASATIAEHGSWFRHISPFWYSAQSATNISIDGNLDESTVEQFVEDARAGGARIVPSIVDGMAPGAMAALLADPAQRAAHVDTIVAFADRGGFDGIDLDYESFAFLDDRATWPTTQPAWIAFVAALGARLHADGRLLTVSVPRADEFWVYDYAAMEPHVDSIRMMAYDYSVATPGPIAPLPWVREVIAAGKAATVDDGKLVLGVALYGRNWPIASVGECPSGEGGNTPVTQRGLAALVARRAALPARDTVAGESTFTYTADFTDGATTCTQTRQVYLVDADGARERIDLARVEGLGGAALWAIGFDSPDTWTAVGSLIRTSPGATDPAQTPSNTP